MQHQTDFLYAAATDAKFPGKSINQDAVFATTGRTGGDIPYGLFVVADGVGGLKDGNRASQATTKMLEKQFKPIWPVISAVSDQTVKRLRQLLKKAILEAHESIQAMSDAKEDRMASTITCAIAIGHVAIVGNSGDSRTYLYRQKQLEQLTKDHSLVAWLVREEHITAEEAKNHPYRNVLTGALGGPDTPQIDLSIYRLFPDDWLILCSDGIWGSLSDGALVEYLQTAASPQQLVPTLMDKAQDNKDDLSLILVKLPQNQQP